MLGFRERSRGRSRCLFSFPPSLTLTHALPLTDLQWAMPVQVVSCTQSIQPRVSTMYTLDPHPLPTHPPRPPHVNRRHNNSHSRTLEILSPSLPCPLSPSSTTSSSSATPEHVSSPTTRLNYISIAHSSIPFSPLSIDTLLYSSQGRRRWLIWDGVVV